MRSDEALVTLQRVMRSGGQEDAGEATHGEGWLVRKGGPE